MVRMQFFWIDSQFFQVFVSNRFVRSGCDPVAFGIVALPSQFLFEIFVSFLGCHPDCREEDIGGAAKDVRISQLNVTASGGGIVERSGAWLPDLLTAALLVIGRLNQTAMTPRIADVVQVAPIYRIHRLHRQFHICRC